jgi:hypothetical protein
MDCLVKINGAAIENFRLDPLSAPSWAEKMISSLSFNSIAPILLAFWVDAILNSACCVVFELRKRPAAASRSKS